MNRIKLEVPLNIAFTCNIPVRITDINYGNHLGNDAILSILHESRVQYLMHLGFTELNIGNNVSLIMSDVAIEFKREGFYGDIIEISIRLGNISRVGFDLYYVLTTKNNRTLLAQAKTGMVCFDYTNKKVASVPTQLINKLIVTIGS